MKLMFTEPTGTVRVDRIAAIKAIRGLTGFGLKDAKDFVDEAQETGEAVRDQIHIAHSVSHYNSLSANGFALLNEQAELIDSLNRTLDIATQQRNYIIIRLMLDAIDVASNGSTIVPTNCCIPSAE